MADLTKSCDLERGDVDSELTKLLRQGYGLLTIKIHGHRISQLDTTTHKRRTGRVDDDE